MVIQQLETVKHLLEQNPPNVEVALRELNIAMQVAMQDYETYCGLQRQVGNPNFTRPVPPCFNWDEPIRPNDQLLKEFGW